MITLELPPQVQSTIEQESQQAGMSIEQYIISKLMLEKTEKPKRQLGFMQGEITVPDDIHWGDDEILADFGESAVKLGTHDRKTIPKSMQQAVGLLNNVDGVEFQNALRDEWD